MIPTLDCVIWSSEMKYSLNDYQAYISDDCTRIEAYPSTELAARLIAKYKSIDATIVPLYKLISKHIGIIVNPGEIIDTIYSYALAKTNIVVFIGIEAYLAFLRDRERRDFFVGIRGLLDKQRINARLVINSAYVDFSVFRNPKYENAMNLVGFIGDDEEEELDIQIIPSKWSGSGSYVSILSAAMEKMGDYVPTGRHVFSMNEEDMPLESYGKVTILKRGKDVLSRLYGLENEFTEEQAGLLLQECNNSGMNPIDSITKGFGGDYYINCERAPLRLEELKEDKLWDLYIWLLKTKIDSRTYLYRVLQQNVTRDDFLYQYVVNTAKQLLDENNLKVYAEERASVIHKLNSVEPLVAQFVEETEGDNRSIAFMNCGLNTEIQGLIRRAAVLDLVIKLPSEFDGASPLINYYFSPDFDYGNKRLTRYFTELRRFRIKDDIDEEFVKKAYQAEVPKEIEKRDWVINKYDDGDTALLLVDGMGAEYYPLLINLAIKNGLKIAHKQIVAVNLPTSTSFNRIKWSDATRLPPVMRIDSISHDGYSKYEKCNYEDNLAEVMVTFQKIILTRVVYGLKQYKRVVVTSDHGSSYLAVNAYNKRLIKVIPWDNPEDWRYAALPINKEVSEDLEAVYNPSNGLTYYVVKGYNRLPKSGAKLYGLHGGATLEERLVPFVVFTNDGTVPEIIDTDSQQFIENDDFDIFD